MSIDPGLSIDPGAIMIFAAGFGTRMGALTKLRPKPLVEVAGRPLIDRALEIATPLGLPITVNTHYRAQMIADHLAPRPEITLSHEAPEILETGGGLKQALLAMPLGPVMTLNPDAVWAGPNPLECLRDAWDSTRMEALLLLVARSRAIGRSASGDFAMTPGGQLSRDKAGLVYTGAHVTKPDRIAQMAAPAFSLNTVWDAMIADGTLFGVTYSGGWADVGTPAGVDQAEHMLRHV